MNIEEKAKRYDEALEKARQIHDADRVSGIELTTCEEIFPELAESKDEKIRKRIIHLVEAHEQGQYKTGCLAWLEKQGEQILANSAKTCKDEQNTVVVTPKFKVGDWVVYYRNDSSREILYVYDIRDGRYYFNDNIHFSWSVKECDEKCHLWTIQDAEAGDVLVSESTCGLGTWYCIFKSLDGDESMTVHCYLSRDGRFETKKELCFDKDPYSTKPATKEQRDLLFQKMKEAGYEWDAEKKELKKVEQKHASWSEEDEKQARQIERIVHNDGCTKKLQEQIANWFKSLKDRVQSQKRWKPSDEQMDALRYVINFDYGGYKATLVSLYEQLKKLKG